MERKAMYTYELTEHERGVLIRFCLTRGDFATISTNCLLRPLDADMLEQAFRAKEAEFEKRELAYVQSTKTFDPSTVSDAMKSYFGGTPTAEQYGKYIASLIKQEEQAKASVRKFYTVNVDYNFVPEDELAFHKSLNPKVTFGYSNVLHEECGFALTDAVRTRLLDSSLGDDPDGQWDYGAFYLGDYSIVYEDLKVTCHGEVMLDTVSHEEIMDVYLTNNDLVAFKDFENDFERNKRIVKKLLS